MDSPLERHLYVTPLAAAALGQVPPQPRRLTTGAGWHTVRCTSTSAGPKISLQSSLCKLADAAIAPAAPPLSPAGLYGPLSSALHRRLRQPPGADALSSMAAMLSCFLLLFPLLRLEVTALMGPHGSRPLLPVLPQSPPRVALCSVSGDEVLPVFEQLCPLPRVQRLGLRPPEFFQARIDSCACPPFTSFAFLLSLPCGLSIASVCACCATVTRRHSLSCASWC